MALSYFVEDIAGDQQLWVTDGTSLGTHAVAASFGGAEISDLTTIGSRVFFVVDAGVRGQELLTFDGTATGPVTLDSLLHSSDIQDLINVNGALYFTTNDDVPRLWQSDGTVAGTAPMAALDASNLTNVNGTLYFTANDGTHGAQVWESNGTVDGTVMATDAFGGFSVGPSDLTNVNGTLYFAAFGAEALALWKVDGFGQVLVNDFLPDLSNLTNVNGTLYFTANDGTHGEQVWRSDGTFAGTVMATDAFDGFSVGPSDLTNVNGTLYFAAFGAEALALWKVDGFGQVLVNDFLPDLSNLTNVNGTLYFTANDGTHGDELWKSDGTFAGTVLVKDIIPGPGSSTPVHLTEVNGALEFYAFDGTSEGLFRSDGTATGTIEIATNIQNALSFPVIPLGVTATPDGDFNGDSRSDILWQNALTVRPRSGT